MAPGYCTLSFLAIGPSSSQKPAKCQYLIYYVLTLLTFDFFFWHCPAEWFTVICAACREDRKSTRLNSSHGYISYAVFCLKKKRLFTTSCKFPVVATVDS